MNNLDKIKSEIGQQKTINILTTLGMFSFMVIAIVSRESSLSNTMIVVGIMVLLSNNWQLNEIKRKLDDKETLKKEHLF